MPGRIKGRRGRGSSRQPRPELSRPARKKPASAPARAFWYLGHPADVGFIARGRTLEKLFAAAALALCSYGWVLGRVRARERVQIRARAATLEDLLYSWLSEVLFLADAERWVFKKFGVERVTGASAPQRRWEVRATARGERFDKRRHRARTYIKAVTYHQLSVQQKDGVWLATVYLDV